MRVDYIYRDYNANKIDRKELTGGGGRNPKPKGGGTSKVDGKSFQAILKEEMEK